MKPSQEVLRIIESELKKKSDAEYDKTRRSFVYKLYGETFRLYVEVEEKDMLKFTMICKYASKEMTSDINCIKQTIDKLETELCRYLNLNNYEIYKLHY